jgi:hypothetical protein
MEKCEYEPHLRSERKSIQESNRFNVGDASLFCGCEARMTDKPNQIPLIEDISIPPQYCQYADGPCDQKFDTSVHSDALFIFPNRPEAIADTIEDTVVELSRVVGKSRWITWKNLDIPGQIIFCEICKAIRFTKLVVADVTTLNFNLLFEIGFALGLGMPVLPIRDTSNIRDAKDFEELGILDTFGYFDYHNVAELRDGVLARRGSPPLNIQAPSLNQQQPLFVVKSPVENDGMIKLMSVIKKSRLRFRTFDSKEVGRISLHDAYKQAVSSRAVILHLLGPDTIGATVHNARCAFIAGIAMAAQKTVLMVQQSMSNHPIDYRDVILTYKRPSHLPDLLIPLLGHVIEDIQTTKFVPTSLKLTPLEKIDLGDLAAENEIRALDSYFVPTAQYQQTKAGHARLVVGRKGAGKTALFYALRSTFWPLRSHVVLDLKPEGHQLAKLREAVLSKLPPGVQQHVLTAFWNYLLVMELAHRIVHHDGSIPYRDYKLKKAFDQIVEYYGEREETEQADFSERLLKLVDTIVEKEKELTVLQTTGDITQLIHARPIKDLNNAISAYLSLTKRDVWLLFDNLDKGWPIHDVQQEDILLLRSLLEATRKLQRQFETRGIELFSVVFIRNDIYQHLILEPADRGKETAAMLDWNDAELFKDIIGRRIAQSTNSNLSFDEIWGTFFTPHVRSEDSFQFVLNRTLLRPREVLRFVRESINTAINRKHETVTEQDILDAERSYSADALVDIGLEMKDVKPEYDNVTYAFIGARVVLSRTEVESKLREVGIKEEEVDRVIDLLLWFGVLGIYLDYEEERYSYQYEHDPKRMSAGLGNFAYCIHPAFRVALGCSNTP